VRGDSRFIGDVEIVGQVRARELVLGGVDSADNPEESPNNDHGAGSGLNTDEEISEHQLESAESQDGEVRLKVVQSEAGSARLVVTSGAEFEGSIVVQEAYVHGRLVVTDGLVVQGHFKLSGAIVHEFLELPGEYLRLGDTVAVTGPGEVGLAYADRIDYDAAGQPEFRPAVGLVVGISALNATSTEALERRVIEVAIGGVLDGLSGLEPGATYYLSDIASYSAQQTATATLPSLAPHQPPVGAASQIMGLAKSDTELIINPSYAWSIVGSDANYANGNTNFANDLAPIIVEQYNINNLIIDNNQETNNNNQTNSNDRIIETENNLASTTESFLDEVIDGSTDEAQPVDDSVDENADESVPVGEVAGTETKPELEPDLLESEPLTGPVAETSVADPVTEVSEESSVTASALE